MLTTRKSPIIMLDFCILPCYCKSLQARGETHGEEHLHELIAEPRYMFQSCRGVTLLYFLTFLLTEKLYGSSTFPIQFFIINNIVVYSPALARFQYHQNDQVASREHFLVLLIPKLLKIPQSPLCVQ